MHFENISAKIAKNRLSLGFDKMKSQMMKAIQYVSADEAVRVVKSHDHIHLSSVASVPHILIQALCRRADAGELEDVRFHHFHTEGPAPYSEPKYDGILFDQGFFLGPNVRANVNAGYADYLPVHLGESQKLYRSGALRCDVAMVQVSLPDENGYVSLGTSVDCSIAAVESAGCAIAVVNPNVPYAYGDLVSIDQFDYFVKDDTPLVTANFAEPTPTEVLIGKNCAELVPDGACIQMGIGALPNALAAQLVNHKDIGVHTEMFADGILRLIKKGVVNGARKKIDTHRPQSRRADEGHQIYERSLDHRPESGHDGHQFGYGGGPHGPDQRRFHRDAHLLGYRRPAGFRQRRHDVRRRQVRNRLCLTHQQGPGQDCPVAESWSRRGDPAGRRPLDCHGIWGRGPLRAKLLITIAHPDDREMLDKAAFDRFGPHYAGFKLYLP